MKTLRIEKTYEHLTTWERVRLKVAAQHRKDEVEANRLSDTAPNDGFRMPPHMVTEMALNTFTLLYLTEQLEHVGGHFFGMMSVRDGKLQDEQMLIDMAAMACIHAYCFHTKAQGWKKFCASIDLDPKALIGGNYDGMMLELCEGQMAKFVPPPEELLDWFRSKGLETKDLMTADSEFRSWRRLLEKASDDAPCFNVETKT